MTVHPDFLDAKVLTLADAAVFLGIKIDELEDLLGDGKEPLLLDYRDPKDDRLTWAEFTTVALFLRCEADPMEYTILVGNDPYFAASREAVLDLVKRANPGVRQGLLGKLRGWNVIFGADEDGWAIRCHPRGRNIWPQVSADGAIELEAPA